MAAADGLIDTAEATGNPYALSFALLAYGFAFRDADPDRAREAMRRGVVIAHDSGNRVNETHLAGILARLEAEHGDPLAALDTSLWRSATTTTRVTPPMMRTAAGCPRRRFSTGSDATNRRPPSPVSRPIPSPQSRSPRFGTAITHLREVLGDQTYESLARKGETMTTAEMATYAYDQIDQARAELEHPS